MVREIDSVSHDAAFKHLRITWDDGSIDEYHVGRQLIAFHDRWIILKMQVHGRSGKIRFTDIVFSVRESQGARGSVVYANEVSPVSALEQLAWCADEA